MRLFFVVCILALAAQAHAARWVFVIGNVGKDDQRAYERTMDKMAAYYGRMGHRVTIKKEAALPFLPKDTIIAYAGPLFAFKNLAKLSLPLTINEDGSALVGDGPIVEKDVGVFLRTKNSSRLLYGGTSLAGFYDIWKVPTGQHACTITKERRILYEGNYVKGELKLIAQSFLPVLPKPSSLTHLKGGVTALEVKRVYTKKQRSQLSVHLRNWLKKTLKDQKALFIGENHWSTRSDQLFKDITLFLAKTQKLRTVFLELQFSASRFFNHYIQLAQDKEAALFREKALYAFVSYENTYKLLDELRQWNRQHPDKKIQVVCHDLEWRRKAPVTQVIVPYFKQLSPQFKLPKDFLSNIKSFKKHMKSIWPLFKKAKKKKLRGPWPFIDASYVGQTLVNLRDTVLLNRKQFNLHRQKSIVRNICRYNQKSFDKGLSVFKVGSFHAAKSVINDNEMRDAAYLQQKFAPTKNKVVSIRLSTVGYNFAPVATIGPSNFARGADQYWEFVQRFNKALPLNKANMNEHYLLNNPNLLELLTLLFGQREGQNMCLLEKINWPRLVTTYGQSAVRAKSQWKQFDGHIIILKSPIGKTVAK